jgi:glutamine cyclotransferase
LKSYTKKKPNSHQRQLIYIAVAAAAAIIILLLGKGDFPQSPLKSSKAPVYTYRIVARYPHDPDAFTQGLVYEGEFLYEGTGRRGHSSLRKVAIQTGEVVGIHKLPDRFFGEGIAVYGDRVIQLTLDAKTAFVYDKTTLEVENEFTYATHGWGLAFDGKDLIMSDGTSALYFMDPESFARVGQVVVKDGKRAVVGLNELEYVNGEIFANVWRTDVIARISPGTGRVSGWIDLTGLLSPEERTDTTGVLNGIAYDAQGDRLFVTGKLWPYLFEIEIIRP